MLADLSRAFATSVNLRSTLNDALADIAESMQVEAGSLFLLDNAHENLVCHACYGPTDILNLSIPAGTGVVGEVVAKRTPSIAQATTESGFSGHVDLVTGFKTRTLLTAPLLAGDSCIGAIQLINPIPATRQFDQASMEALRVLASAAGLALVNARLTKQMVNKAKTEAEMAMAREVQQAILNLKPSRQSGFAGINLAARQVSGDFYNFWESGSETHFCIADVSGKGAHAGILMARVATLWRMMVKQSMSPPDILTAINTEILETSYRGMFCTMVTGIRRGNELSFAMAGHEPVLQYLNESFESFTSERPPLGITKWAGKPTSHLIDLSQGPAYFYTDGLTDGLLADGSTFEREGLQKLVPEIYRIPAEIQCQAIARKLTAHGGALADDLTLVVATGV